MESKINVVNFDQKISNQNIPYGVFNVKREFSNAGSPVEAVYAPEILANGEIELHEVGTMNIQDEIDSHRDSVDISTIMSRYANGDLKALERRQALYFDATDAPTSYVEMLNRAMKAEQYFNTLDSDERDKFGNDWTRWLAEFDKADSSVVKDFSKEKMIKAVADARNVAGDAGDTVSSIEYKEELA